jgi:hypothetical protein
MFISSESGLSLRGSLIYTESEYGFQFEPDDPDDLHRRTGSEAWTTLQIGTVQVSVGIESHQALYVWGYHPKTRWSDSELVVPTFSQGRVFVDPEYQFTLDVSISIAPVNSWATRFDRQNGWISVISLLEQGLDIQMIEIADGTVLGLQVGELI